MNMLKMHGNNDHQWIHVFGDKKKQHEPKELSIRFPGGHIAVARHSDGTFWAHINVNSNLDTAPDVDGKERGKFIEARIDCRGLAPQHSDLGSLTRSDCNHVALRIAKA